MPKVAELVAAQLRWRIVTSELRDGGLPRESDMLAESNASTHAFHLRLTELCGTRRGPRNPRLQGMTGQGGPATAGPPLFGWCRCYRPRASFTESHT
ncbi:hypothetical protein FMEAI12_5130002 [Parafrankia sp. Ea1.12]|nr:hypothetical protein FMEAI12_5130002 [Parafrankia sp. Ea1.12]